jgi:hypothetical protein
MDGALSCCDIIQQLKAMRGWSLANPKKAKTVSGMPRFINSWLAKDQNKGGINQQRGMNNGRQTITEADWLSTDY